MIASNKLRVLVGIAAAAFSLLCAVLAGREFDRGGTVVNKEMAQWASCGNGFSAG